MSSARNARNALNAISLRTGVPLPSLLLSFGILHEVTAVVPLVGFFYIGRGLNIGESVVSAVVQPQSDAENMSWIRSKCVTWVKEGEGWAERVGRRYGVFGFDKNDFSQPSHLAGDIANAVFAYGATKAVLPVRIGLSMYLAPAFSRGVVEPLRHAAMRAFRRR